MTNQQKKFTEGKELRTRRDVSGTVYNDMVDYSNDGVIDVNDRYSAAAYHDENAMDPYEIKHARESTPVVTDGYAIDNTLVYAVDNTLVYAVYL